MARTAVHRAPFLAFLALIWSNYLLTARWADIPGALHGPKEPWFLAALLVVTAAALLPGTWSGSIAGWPGWVTLVAGAGLMLVGIWWWLPPSDWSRIPFLDNWPPRFDSTRTEVELLWRGLFGGWNWDFLGGYPRSTDVTQGLTLLAAVPMAVFGPLVGFHLLHALLLVAIPTLVYADLRLNETARPVAAMSAGVTALLATNFSYFVLRSGDTNTLTGLVCAVAALLAAHAARCERRWGGPLLVVALTATTYSHRGFFVYAVTLLAVDAVAARDRRSAVRAGIAAATACVAALPVTWEHYRYPAQFLFNNAILTPPPFEWTTVAQHVYYNLEILVLPGRWFNDYTGFANALIPVALWMAIKASGRERQYAWLLLAAIGLGRFNAPHFGYGFARAIHLLPVYSSAVLCGYLARWGRGPVLAVATAALVGLYVQIWWVRVPHVENLREFDAALVDRVARLDGHLILLENNWHPDADPTPGRQTEATPFGVHFEALLPRATGKRFYAGYWDGWQWTPARHRVLANGAFQGRLLDTVDPGAFEHELRRWGVRHLVVWSASARAYLTRNTRFVQAWEHGRWAHFELREADIRSVVVQGGGSATLTGTHAFGGEVHLASAREGALVVVRTSYHPSWEAESGTGRLAVDDHDGQIAFRAPCSGDCVVRLIYPTRRWLLVLSMAGLAAGLLVVTRVRGLGAGPQRAPV